MHTIIFSLLFCLFLLISALRAAGLPNVIVVLTDDQGFGDVSLYGNPVINTPNMDALAKEGVSFHQFHVTSMCAPTRAALLTGRNPLENGAISTCQGLHSIRHGLPTLPQVMADAGYATGIFGKWHLGRNWPNRPQDKGFQETFALYGFGTTGISSRWNNDYVDTWVVHNGEEKQTDGFNTDVFFDQAMDWIEQQGDTPFFAYIPTTAPHFPFWAPEELTAEYADTKNPEFFALLDNLDMNMGRLEAFLEERGLKDDTIVIFMSDNGPVGGKSTYNAGMTGSKASPWEAGHRVPCFIRYPAGGIEGGRVVEGLADVTDIFPTLLDLCGIDSPEDVHLPGISLRPAMLGEGQIATRTIVMQIQQGRLDPKRAAIMSDQWRLLWCDSLYDIERDLSQQTKFTDEHPDVFLRLWQDYQRYYGRWQRRARRAQPEIVGSPHQATVILDGSNWLEVRADGQKSVRKAKGASPDAARWKIKAYRAGTYRIALRRWPVESGLALDAAAPPFETRLSGEPLPQGTALPITRATLEVDGRLYRKAAQDDPTAVVFDIELEEGVHMIQGLLRDDTDRMQCGAYYAYVEKM